MKREYQTSGYFYVAPTMTGNKGLLGLDYKDYGLLLSTGLMDEEVGLTMQKTEYGHEYTQGAPTYSGKAGLYTVTIEGMHAKPQIDIPESEVDAILDRGFKDGDKVDVTIKGLPYRTVREASYDGLKLDRALSDSTAKRQDGRM